MRPVLWLAFVMLCALFLMPRTAEARGVRVTDLVKISGTTADFGMTDPDVIKAYAQEIQPMCTGVTTFTFSPKNPYLEVIDGGLYGVGFYENRPGEKQMLLYPPARQAESIQIDEETTVIGPYCFYQCGASEIVIPEGVQEIGDGAFTGCSDLADLELPAELFSLGGNAFDGCANLDVFVPPQIQVGSYDTKGLQDVANIRGVDGSPVCLWAAKNGIPFEPVGQTRFAQRIRCIYKDQTINMTYGDSVTIYARAVVMAQGCYWSLSDPTMIGELDDVVDPIGEGESGCMSLRFVPCKAGTTMLTLYGGENLYFDAPEPVNITINVAKKPQTVTAKASYKGTCGSTLNLGAASVTAMTYASSDPKTVSVDSKGTLSFKKPGKVTVTIKAKETDQYATAQKKVTVTSTLKKPVLSASSGHGWAKITWTQVPAADTYEIYVKYPGAKSFKRALTRPAKVKSVTHKGLKVGKTYQYVMRARRRIGSKYYYSPFSNVKTIRVK